MTDKNATTSSCLNGHEKIEKFTCTIKHAPLDIIVYVPGTTDPVNTAKNAADICYWVTNPNLVTFIEDLRSIYDNIYVNKDFSWSGDNSADKRIAAGESLAKFLLRYYSGRMTHTIAFHLVGHSHGGNVINEFTHVIDKLPDFPENWQIKSITYLSTPFFNTLHQVKNDCKHFHKDIKVNNVYNDFDLTQRVVADFSMKQLGFLIDLVERNTKITEAKKSFTELNTSTFSKLKPSFNQNDSLWKKAKKLNTISIQDGRDIWETTIKLIDTLTTLLRETNSIFASLNSTNPEFVNNNVLNTIRIVVSSLLTLLQQPRRNLQNRLEEDRRVTNGATTGTSVYTRTRFADDIMIYTTIYQLALTLNNFIDYDDSSYTGNFTKMLDEMLFSQIYKFDNTYAKPDPQFKGKVPISHIPVRKYDPYVKLKDAQFEKFILALENLENKYQNNQIMKTRMEIIFSFLAELDYSPYLSDAIDWIDILMLLSVGKTDTELSKLKKILSKYQSELNRRHCGIVYEPDKVTKFKPTVKPIPKGLEMCPNPWLQGISNPTPRIRPFVERRGSLGYLAVTSHSISRLTLYDEVKSEIKSVLETKLKTEVGKPESLKLKKKAS